MVEKSMSRSKGISMFKLQIRRLKNGLTDLGFQKLKYHGISVLSIFDPSAKL